LNFTTFAYNQTGADTGVLGINFAGASGKTSAFMVNNSILHDGTSTSSNAISGTPYSFGDAVTITAGRSTNNIYTNYSNFVGANGLTDGNANNVTAYLPYGDLSSTVAVRDGYANLVGDSAGSTKSDFITQNLYLSTDMDYTGNRHARALALQSVNSIANRYSLDGGINETYAGNISMVASYDRDGNYTLGQISIDDLSEVHYWSSHSGGTAEYEAYASKEPLALYAAGLLLTKVNSGLIDSLTAGQWTWDSENNVIVVRLADDVDPSSIAMTKQTDINETIVYDQRGNMRSGVTVGDSLTVEKTSWTQYGENEDEYQISSDYEVTGVTVNFESDSITLTEGTSIDSLEYGEWIYDAENNIVIVKVSPPEGETMSTVDLTTKQVTYSYYTYGQIDAEDTWMKVVVAENGTITRTEASASDVHVGLGAFKANLYMTVTTNADNTASPYAIYGMAPFESMDNALEDGVTLREAVYWIDSYDLTGLTVTGVSGNVKFDADRYVKFADSMFENGNNLINLTAGQITTTSDVVIGMINEYGDGTTAYSYTDGGGTTHYFKADNSFLAQDDSSRITISGLDKYRIFGNYSHYDHSDQSGRWSVSPTSGLNNMVLTDGYIINTFTSKREYSYFCRGGAIYNDFSSTMYLNNTVVKDSEAATNGNYDYGWGGGIYNAGTMVIQDSTITGNLANGSGDTDANSSGLGGGIYNSGTMTITRSLISDNHVIGIVNKDTLAGNMGGTGGGIYTTGGTLNLYSSTLAENYINAGTSETVDGAALTVWSGTANLYGNTIAYNKTYDGTGQETATSRPGYAVYLRSGTSSIRNNIFAQNYIEGDTSQNRRDIIVTNSVSLADHNNIVGSYYQGSDYYDFALNASATNDILGFNASGLVTNLNMSNELLYNGGMTQNYRIETASAAIGAGDYTGLGIVYDQRNAIAGTDYTTRSTIGAYELITSITIDSDVADAALPAGGIAYDYENDRGGWTVNLRNALYLADQGATVTVNVIPEYDSFALTAGELLIFNGITLTTDGSVLTIDAGEVSRIFAITDPVSARVVDVSLSNLNLINGNSASDDRSGLGGAIYTTEGLTLNNVTIEDVTAFSHGGAIYSLAGGLTMTDVTITNAESINGDGGAINLQTDVFAATNLNISNSSAGGSGGAIYITDGSTFSLTGTSSIHDSTSGAYGGGIYFRGGDMTITDAYIYNNTAASDKDGGGLYVNSSGNIAIVNSTFGNSTDTSLEDNNGNTAARGAGIFVYAGSLSMTNSTISGNTASKDGGGLYFDGTSLNLKYVTVANNYAGASYNGGGIYMNNGSLTMINTVIAQNYAGTTDSPSDFYLSTGTSVSSATYSAIGESNYDFSTGTGNIVGTDGVIDNLGLDTTLYDNGGATPTLYVMSTSVLVGKGQPNAVLVSQNGRIRATGDPADNDGSTIGAYEGGSTTYYYIGGDVDAESSWNTVADGSGTTLADGGFEDADNSYIFTNNGHAGDFSTGTWEISDRSFVTVAAGGMFTISGDAVVRAFVHRTPTTQANMVVNVEGTGNLTFNTGVAQSVTLTTLESDSNVNYIYAGDQTVYTATYGNLTVSGTGTKTAEEVITVDGNMINSSTLTSGYNLTVDGNLANSGSITAVDITVNGNTTGIGSLSGTNIYLNGTGNNISGDVTAVDDLTFAGGTSTGTLTGTTVNAEGTVANVNATTLNSTSLAVTGTVNTTDLNVTTLGLSNDASVNTVNANLTTINSTGGSNTLKAITASTSDVNYTSWIINASGNSTLVIDRGTNDILISENGSVTDSFNINNMDVDSGSTVKFATEGNASLTDIDSAALAGTYDGTLWIKSYDISLPGCDFSGGNMSIKIENSGYFDLVAGTTLTFGKGVDINNVRIIAGLPSATLATLASTSGDVSIGNVVSLSPTYSIFLNAANGSTTIGGASGITNVIMNAANTATSDGAIDILGNFDATAATVTIQNDVTVGGSFSVTGNLVLGADIAADGNVGVSGTTDLTGDSSISGDTLTLSGAISDSGTSNLTLEATGIGDNSLPSVNIGGDLTILGGAFTTAQDITSANFELQSPATMTFTDGALTTGNLTNAGNLTLFDPAAVSGNLNNSGILSSGDVSIDGNLTNTGTFNSTGNLTVLGDIINTSTNTLSALTLNASGNIDDTGAINVTNLVLKNNTGLGAAVNDICFSDGTTFNTFTVEADKHVRLVDGNIIVGNFVFAADATPTSTFEISSGTSVTVNNSINYNVAGANYDGHYFIVSNDSRLIQTMNNTDAVYRLANSGYVTEITLNTGAAGIGEKIAVGIIDNVTVAGDTVSGIDDTVKFTTVIDRNYGGGSYAGDITFSINWDSSQEGNGFVPANADLFSYGNGEWTTLGTVTVTTPSAGRHAISGFVLPHNGMYTIANADAEMTVPPLPNNVNIYEMANAHYIPMYPDLDTNIFLNFPVGFYPYYVSDRYFTPSNLHSVGQAVYRQMEYRWITNPETNILGGQVPPPGAVLGQAITEQASLTLTSDAPVYLEVNGEYSVGEGWVPITEPASVENIEQYQEPVTQGQIDQFYLDFGQREDIFDKPLSFKSDLDEMLDNLLAG
jgi:hypothetical protein